jgi:Glycosyltransferases involved in cell wall biogenesis
MTVDVVVISFNHNDFIGECLDAILNQKVTFSIKVILSDDCSSDDSPQIIKDYVDKYPTKIQAFFQKENLGPISNFQFAINQCQGDYIAICEGDDYWTDPLKLQKQIDYLENHPDVIATFHNAAVVDHFGNKLYSYCSYSSTHQVSDESVILIGGGLFPTASLVFRNIFKNSPLKGIDKYKSGDRALIYELLLNGKIVYLNELMSAYRVHDQGIFSSSISDKQKSLAIHYSNLELLADYAPRFGQNYEILFKKAISIQWKYILLKENASFIKIVAKYSDLTIKDFIYLVFKLFTKKQ